MTFWHQIQGSFRGAFEGAVFAFTALIILGFGLPVIWYVFGERLRRHRRLSDVRGRLLERGLDSGDWGWLSEAIRATCPDNPQRILDNVSLFHEWVDGLPDGERSRPEALARLDRIEETAWPGGATVYVPRSTRDLVAGASLNLVRHGDQQDVVPCVISEVRVDGLTLVKRSQELPVIRAGEEVHLYYPRPEAMYHAVCRAAGAEGGRLQLLHAAAGQFKVRQLREFWRVDVDIPVAFRLQGAGEDEGGEAPPAGGEGRLINLSGNGAALVSRARARRGQRVRFGLPVMGKTLQGIEAEILHVTSGRFGHRFHMVFRNLDPADQDLIVRSLFLWFRHQQADSPPPPGGPALPSPPEETVPED